MSKRPTPDNAKVALPPDLWEAMKAAGKKEERPGSYMVVKACKEFLERSGQPVAATSD